VREDRAGATEDEVRVTLEVAVPHHHASDPLRVDGIREERVLAADQAHELQLRAVGVGAQCDRLMRAAVHCVQ
jgi:hypothetical protein